MAEVNAYEVTYNLSATNEDENPDNNTATQSFEVSNLHYGRDNGTMTGAFPGEGTDDFIALAPYDIFEDVTVYAIDVAIVAGSEDGTPVIAHLFDGSDENYITEQYGGLFASTAELDLASQYSNDGTEDDVLWYTLVLEEPAQLAAGSVIGAGFEHYGGSSVQIWESQYAYDNTWWTMPTVTEIWSAAAHPYRHLKRFWVPLSKWAPSVYICPTPLTSNCLRMKHFYTAALAVLMTTAVTAQGLLPIANKTANQRRVESFNTPTQVDREVIWSHDCNVDSCDSWTFDNGASIVGSPWEEIDLNFECTTDGPAGPYNQWAGGTGDGSAASAMNSTTSSNGLLIVDSDLFGQDANYDAAWIENSWVQTANSIDCSTLDYVSISLETRYRCWDNGASDDSEKCLIEISRDGVNWPDIETFAEIDGTVDYGDGELIASRWEVFPGYGTGDGSDNPSLLEFDITSAAGGQEQIWVRFRWSGTWGYSWEIDDIQIYETPANDLRIGPVARVDNAYGDRNLVCSCPPLSSFEEILGSTL